MTMAIKIFSQLMALSLTFRNFYLHLIQNKNLIIEKNYLKYQGGVHQNQTTVL